MMVIWIPILIWTIYRITLLAPYLLTHSNIYPHSHKWWVPPTLTSQVCVGSTTHVSVGVCLDVYLGVLLELLFIEMVSPILIESYFRPSSINLDCFDPTFCFYTFLHVLMATLTKTVLYLLEDAWMRAAANIGLDLSNFIIGCPRRDHWVGSWNRWCLLKPSRGGR